MDSWLAAHRAYEGRAGRWGPDVRPVARVVQGAYPPASVDESLTADVMRLGPHVMRKLVAPLCTNSATGVTQQASVLIIPNAGPWCLQDSQVLVGLSRERRFLVVLADVRRVLAKPDSLIKRFLWRHAPWAG